MPLLALRYLHIPQVLLPLAPKGHLVRGSYDPVRLEGQFVAAADCFVLPLIIAPVPLNFVHQLVVSRWKSLLLLVLIKHHIGNFDLARPVRLVVYRTLHAARCDRLVDN